MMARTTQHLVAALLLLSPAAARWCQVENVKADVHGNYSFAGTWRIDGCTTLSGWITDIAATPIARGASNLATRRSSSWRTSCTATRRSPPSRSARTR